MPVVWLISQHMYNMYFADMSAKNIILPDISAKYYTFAGLSVRLLALCVAIVICFMLSAINPQWLPLIILNKWEWFRSKNRYRYIKLYIVNIFPNANANAKSQKIRQNQMCVLFYNNYIFTFYMFPLFFFLIVPRSKAEGSAGE